MEEEKNLEEKKKFSIKDFFKNLSKKQIIVIVSIVISLIVIISVLNTFNRRKLDIVNREVAYGDVKSIRISNDKNNIKLTDEKDLKSVYFILYRYSNGNNNRVVKDYTLDDPGTVIVSINDEYDIYLYRDRNKKYYMGYKNEPSFEMRYTDYEIILSYLDKK